MATVLLDLTRNSLPNLPQELPAALQVKEGALIEGGGWCNTVARSMIPGYAKAEDAKVTNHFLDFFKDIIAEKKCVPSDQLKKVIRFAEQHIATRIAFRQERNFQEYTQEIATLERYTFAVRIKLNDFESSEQKEILREVVKDHNQSLFTKWDQLNFDNKPEDKQAFWAHPDMVDFVFNQHLHRYIRHPDYRHKIEMWPVQKHRDGSSVIESEAHLKMNGCATPWSTIRNMLKVEPITERLYSEDVEGNKLYWMYLDEGFVQHDRHDLKNMRRIKRLEHPPSSCKVQLITTHAPKDKWFCLDRLLQGARHTFFRVVIGEGFQRSHPDLPYRDGEVYSIGFGGPGGPVDLLQPLTTFKGMIYSPDTWEFYSEDLNVTDIDATDDKIINLFHIVKQRANEEVGFHVFGSNCATNGIAMLRDAQILDIPTKNHMITMWYEFIFSEDLRRYIDKGVDLIVDYTPENIKEVVKNTGLFIYSLVFSPLFLFLGAWRTNISFDPESSEAFDAITAAEGVVRANNRIKALFSNIYDFFDPQKMSFDLTLNVWRWQLKHAKAYPESLSFINRNNNRG